MSLITRRRFIELAASIGASLAWPSGSSGNSKSSWTERRDFYPQGVASGDPYPDSILLWTRRAPFPDNEAKKLQLEIADDQDFENVIATTEASVSSDTDWTCRVLVANLQPRHIYWYRFTDEHGFGSRIGRAITAPSNQDSLPIRFTFVSCQNVQQGACNAYRKMIWEDEQRRPEDQLGFVLHLGDFIYEIVWYPEDRPQGMYDRKIRDIVRFPNGEKMRDFHVPTTLEDYRAVYRAYLTDPDLQDARSRWPFVCVWDNHEFSWKGWQSMQSFETIRPGQRVKVAANQAWFEYQPARVSMPGKVKGDRFEAPSVENAPISKFDENGLGQEPGNLAAIHSLKIHRDFRYGRNVDFILTDNHSFCSEPVADGPNGQKFQPQNTPLFFPAEIQEILDGGKSFNGGKPPESIEFDGKKITNPRKNDFPQSVLGGDQKKWFLQRLQTSKAPWKLWGNSFGMLDWRVDLQNLPSELRSNWPVDGYATLGGDWTAYRTERAEILNFVKREKITGLVNIVGDRHSFFAGVLSANLPPKPYEPVAAEFITGSVSAPGLAEALKYIVAKDDPLKSILHYKPTEDATVQPLIQLSMLHGVRSSLALQKTKDLKQALAARNREVSPHLSFADFGGHGYGLVCVKSDEVEVEFVCIPAPIERSEHSDGGPLRYRVAHRLKLWQPGKAPQLELTKKEGDAPLVTDLIV